MEPSSTTILYGDVGGTNSRLYLKTIQQNTADSTIKKTLIKHEVFKTVEFGKLDDVIRKFLEDIQPDQYPKAMAIGVLGVRRDNIIQFGKLKWEPINTVTLPQVVKIDKAAFLNDFEACAHGILNLGEDDYVSLNEKEPKINAAKALIGPGTGLGESILVMGLHKKYIVVPTEGGYTNFAPTNDLEFLLLKHMQNKIQSVCVPVDKIVSGLGIIAIFNFLVQHYKNHESIKKSLPQPTEQITSEDIVEFAMQTQDQNSLEKHTLDMFLSIFGTEAGNLALKTLAFGGIYLIGNISWHLKDYIKTSEAFWDGFYKKEKLEDTMKTIPVYVVQEIAGILGAEGVAIDLLSD